MSENLTSRVGRLLSGTANSLVDALENVAPEMVMEEAVREVDRAIDDVRNELGRVLSSRHLAGSRLAQENRKHEELSEKAALALKQGREDLAEAAVSRLMDVEAQIPVLEATIAQANEAEAELEGYIAALQARKREMQEELKNYRDAQAGTADGPSDDGGAGGGTVDQAVRRAESTFDRVLESASMVPGSGTRTDRKSASQMAELDELARQNRIKERLASLKAEAKV